MNPRKILILVPASSALGGVTTYINIIKKEFTIDIDYLIRGNRTYPFRKSKFYNLIRFLKDIILFKYTLILRRYKLIQTNTSFDKNGILRDCFYVMISKFFFTKVIVFYHGWNHDFVNLVERRYLKLFKFVFFRANAFVVLSSEFQDTLRKWGYTKPIYIETTIVDKDLVKNISEAFIIKKYSQIAEQKLSLLYLARIEKGKGIYIALQAYNILKQKYPNLSMTIAGDGLELDNIKTEIKEKNIPDIIVTGHIVKDEIKKTFASSSIYILPSFTEGMPTSVLEAMAFGLPVITRPVGGLKDFFSVKMGFATESYDPICFAELIDKLLQDPEKMKEIAMYNYFYAREHFISNVVVKRIEKIYLEMEEKKN
jgi:glycosyltransferase involved in cell wall biosynthesis